MARIVRREWYIILLGEISNGEKCCDLEILPEYFSQPSEEIENVWHWDQVDMGLSVISSESEYIRFLINKMGILMLLAIENYYKLLGKLTPCSSLRLQCGHHLLWAAILDFLLLQHSVKCPITHQGPVLPLHFSLYWNCLSMPVTPAGLWSPHNPCIFNPEYGTFLFKEYSVTVCWYISCAGLVLKTLNIQ